MSLFLRFLKLLLIKYNRKKQNLSTEQFKSGNLQLIHQLEFLFEIFCDETRV